MTGIEGLRKFIAEARAMSENDRRGEKGLRMAREFVKIQVTP
jgi:hypothetical protein